LPSPGEGLSGEARLRLLYEILSELESLRNRIPESVADGSLEEALREASIYTPEAGGYQGVYRSLYTGLSSEAAMLAQLAAAMRMRMEKAGTPYISGVDYLRRRLDSFIARLAVHLAGEARGRRWGAGRP
jgi:hypothetical protein